MLKNAIDIFSVSTVSSGIRFLVEVIIARILSVEAFGIYALITSLIAILQVLISGGVRPVIQRKLAIAYNKKTFEFFEIFFKSLSLFFLAILTIFFMNEFIYVDSSSNTNISTFKTYFNIILVGSVATAVLFIVSDIYRVIGSFKSFIFYKEAIFPIIFLAMMSLAWILRITNVQNILSLLIASLIISSLIGIVNLKKEIFNKNIHLYKKGKKLFKNRDLLLFWASSEVLGILWVIRDRFAVLTVSEYMTMEDVGLLFVMLRLMMPILIIKSSFNSTISPVIANLYYNKSLRKLNKKYSELSKFLFLFTFPVFILISSFGLEITSLILGSKYELNILATSLLTWSVSVSVMLGPSGVALQMCGRPNVESWFLALSLFLIVAISMYLVPIFGLLGAIISVYYVITSLDMLRYMYVKKALGIKAHDKKIGFKIVFIMMVALIQIVFNTTASLFNFVFLNLIFIVLFNKEIINIKKSYNNIMLSKK